MQPACDVYWNSHRKLFSIRQDGIVVDQAERLIVDDPIFLVNPVGQARVRRTHTKEVHAVIRGTVRVCGTFNVPEGALRVLYNPYCDLHFREEQTNRNVLKRDQAFFTVADRHPAVFAL